MNNKMDDDKWYYVNRKLPKEREHVLVLTKKGDYSVMFYCMMEEWRSKELKPDWYVAVSLDYNSLHKEDYPKFWRKLPKKKEK